MSARNRYRPWFAPEPMLRYLLETGGRYAFYVKESIYGPPRVELNWISEDGRVEVVDDPDSTAGKAWIFPIQPPTYLGVIETILDDASRPLITNIRDPYEDP